MTNTDELVDAQDAVWEWLAADLNCSLTRSTMLRPEPSAILLNTGGILLHDNWVRVYGGSGGGPDGIPCIAEVNGFHQPAGADRRPPAGLVVAHDVLGGVFARNGPEPRSHGRPGRPDEVIYFCPATLAWQTTGLDHDRWLDWLVNGGAAGHYREVLWPTWRSDTAELGPRQGMSVHPAPWSAEAEDGFALPVRRPVPLQEVLDGHVASCVRLSRPHSGALGTVEARAAHTLPAVRSGR
ncbi:DUF2625 family protein [Lentzea albida]|uniref:DUF2625 domain-containing protein n=1 Tax=Lentzea albida TaxID=65499 RepID=A0A1H9VC01_9PSEU|nr:DUF2625 family protein [Lentzea albida]SES19330.1 Protein of unknown function DUF2625 [Lentzea albida]